MPILNFDIKKVNPSASQHKCWVCSGLTLSGPLNTALKGGVWGRRMGQVFGDSVSSVVSH